MQRLKDWWLASFYDPGKRVVVHAGFWALFLFYMRQDSRSVYISPELPLWITLTGILLHLVLFYPLVYVIIPFLRKKKWWWAMVVFLPYYAVAVALKQFHMVAFGEWINEGIVIQYDGERLWKQLVASDYNPLKGIGVFLSILVYLASEIFIPLWIKIMRNAYRHARRQAELEKQNSRLLLEQLRAQINPHLFFNTLNNLQSFIVQQDRDRAVLLLKQLSDFMRISLYELNREWIPLEKEVELVNNYIGIERVRFEEDARICVDIGIDRSGLRIPPLLLLPFVENAFKYSGQVSAADVFLSVKLEISDEVIRFAVVNRFAENHHHDSGGMGLDNVRRRLKHYYPGQHSLDLHRDNDLFRVELKIPAQ